MSLDLSRVIGAVTRSITQRMHAGQMARVLVAERDYDTSRADLWDALTNPERIPRWFLPISGDFRVGGHYQFEGNAGGTIETCDAPEHLAVTWVMQGQDSWVRVRLHDKGPETTHLVLEHIAHVPEAMWQQFGPGGVGVGWDGGLLGLDQLYAEAPSVDPTTAMTWAGTDEGKAFFTMSSEAWTEASIAAGTDPEEARRAGARTTAMYTGAPMPED